MKLFQSFFYIFFILLLAIFLNNDLSSCDFHILQSKNEVNDFIDYFIANADSEQLVNFIKMEPASIVDSLMETGIEREEKGMDWKAIGIVFCLNLFLYSLSFEFNIDLDFSILDIFL